ncbi:hypothetical protein C0J52_19815 [Blattella germanica]|nr:hypothetical protein C0J52_19815 [Blattella germanica]
MQEAKRQRHQIQQAGDQRVPKMADDVENLFESALENLVSVTEKSGNLRRDLREIILKSVSIRNVFTKLKSSIASNLE